MFNVRGWAFDVRCSKFCPSETTNIEHSTLNSERRTLNLLPCPRSLKRLPGTLTLPDQNAFPTFTVLQSDSTPPHPEGHVITINRQGVKIEFRENAGLRAA